MSNENVKRGLDPMPDNKGQIECRYLVPISASNNTVSALFAGSPYHMVSGTVVASVSGHSSLGTNGIAGSVVKLYDSNKKPVTNLPVSTAGYADVTYRADQRYQCTITSTTFADDGSDNGKTYDLTAESATANSNGRDGASYSSIQLTSEATSGNQITVAKKVDKPGNLGGVAGTLVECTITAALWQQW